jgi:hypothetical protein
MGWRINCNCRVIPCGLLLKHSQKADPPGMEIRIILMSTVTLQHRDFRLAGIVDGISQNPCRFLGRESPCCFHWR